ncbi:hypothetical protein [Pseudomonas gingeri]|uniref:Transglutaminase-like domain-containing protein n=1 Tax=Pseudomonas gingeri TaxID=117681 RepID=A0A7Y8BKH3_9PSED|nr:hypothetical protein [Pseudomonas gingeri]NWB47085.1 hypothetical protein [Pseudomonas gingeri]
MKFISALVFLQCLLISMISKADPTSALIKSYAVSRNLPIIDAVREFIHQNSDHGEGVWNQAHGNDNAYVLDHLYRTAIGDISAKRPELLCGNRSTAMQALLSNLGIRSRTIYLYSQYSGSFMGHVFVEAMNPATGSWEIQDADYNVAYEDEDGHRLGIAQMIATSDFSKVYPVNAVARGWEAVKVERLMIGQFFNLAYSPTEGMLYYNQQASDTGLVAAAETYIHTNFGKANYIPAQIGSTLVRPLLVFKGGVYEHERVPLPD